jgi:hypothetical protein
VRDNRPYDLKCRSDQHGSEAKQTKVVALTMTPTRLSAKPMMLKMAGMNGSP